MSATLVPWLETVPPALNSTPRPGPPRLTTAPRRGGVQLGKNGAEKPAARRRRRDGADQRRAARGGPAGGLQSQLSGRAGRPSGPLECDVCPASQPPRRAEPRRDGTPPAEDGAATSGQLGGLPRWGWLADLSAGRITEAQV